MHGVNLEDRDSFFKIMQLVIRFVSSIIKKSTEVHAVSLCDEV